MSSRGRRGRGRPPRTPSLSTKSTNVIRKPKSMTGGDSDSRSSTPVSSRSCTPNLRSRTSARLSGRSTPRESIHKPKSAVSRVVYDDNSEEENNVENHSYSDSDKDSEPDLSTQDSDDNEFAAEETESDWSEESFSTVGSSSRRKMLLPRRPPTPEFYDEVEVPPLELPPSATDLLVEGEHLVKALGIYEVLRHFRTNIRLSPFRFEDFCAALVCEEQSTLLGEVHTMLLKALLREEDGSNSTFCPQDMKDSVNVGFFFLDGLTWYECVRMYLDSDKSADFRAALPALENSDYTRVSLAERIKILQTLTDLFLSSNSVRETIINEGNIQYDDHCRNCYRYPITFLLWPLFTEGISSADYRKSCLLLPDWAICYAARLVLLCIIWDVLILRWRQFLMMTGCAMCAGLTRSYSLHFVSYLLF